MSTSPELVTIGHSDRALEEFIALLKEHHAEVVVDVRKLPGSKRHPHFNEDVLAESLCEHGIELRRLEALTGRRPVSRTVPFEVNGWWQHRSFHNYADHALGDDFDTDLARLREWSADAQVAVMCAEAVWWRCHRRIIADHLLARGDRVVHVMSPGQAPAALLSEGAAIGEDGTVTYPAGGEAAAAKE